MRKIKRNIIRNKMGNKALRSTWKKYQQEKYGKDYLALCVYIHN